MLTIVSERNGLGWWPRHVGGNDSPLPHVAGEDSIADLIARPTLQAGIET